ncbi:hypothetical protein [Ciceribacter sp. L1K22]|uniref:hypothetical protein n=1 Tax=Ciceribacter sp. L1K22 TaxID=2820275 RepID=UPI001ABDC7E0|nr:hypothetical protein [Ciceribacter sp. L1K22]MBO3761132.1 hypothetical protein [Ciceribacter sp. L1K22]
MNAPNANPTVTHYFNAIHSALGGLEIYLSNPDVTLPAMGSAGGLVLPYVERLKNSFACWENRIGFTDQFRISKAESGFPIFQNVLELENDRGSAPKRLAAIPDANALRAEIVDFILRQKEFPTALQTQMAERLYLEQIGRGEIFSPFVMPETVRVTVNEKTRRPYYVVTWAVFDGTNTLPMIYAAGIEDSSDNVAKLLVTPDGKLNPDVDIPLPVGGLLNPELAARFDDFAAKNGAYSLTPATVIGNMDKDFETLHPKQMNRMVLGPFYAAGITENNGRVTDILTRVRKPENAWVLTWTMQEIFSKTERPAQKGFFSSTPAIQEFHIETGDLEAARMGVSAYQKHALVPHDAYQALYASGEASSIFAGYKVHVISGSNVVSEV